LTLKLVSPAADRKVKSVKVTQLVDHLNVYHLRHLRLQVRCLGARRLASIGLKQVVKGLTITIVEEEEPPAKRSDTD
tara:strand:- start:1074 stop:1304 length:231 start_codon:yes stop_codon:yes gene_type:complete